MIKAGTGSYKIEIPLDENEGGQIRPNMEEIQANEASVIKKTSVKLVTEVNKNAVAKVVTSENNACLLGYYCDVDQVITSNRNKIASSKREAREFITGKAVSLNGDVVTDENMVITKAMALEGKVLIFRRGKKKYFIGKV